MALGSGNAELSKKNSKFESFLKRSIPDEAFERVRAYESCIVVSEKEDKAFKFVVLSDEKIYLTENPPKTLKEALHLRDVTSVELVNEYPAFLTGEERTNTQHIAVSFITTEPRRRSLRRAKRSPRGSVSDLNGERSNTSTPLGYASSTDSNYPDDQGYFTHSTTSLSQSRPTSRGSIKAGVQNKKKKKPPGLNDSFDHDSILRSLKEEIEEDILDDIEEDRLSMIKSTVPLGNSRTRINSETTSHGKGGLNSSVGGLGMRDRAGSDRKLVGGGAGDNASVRSASQQSIRPLPPMPKTGAFETVVKPSVSETEMQTLLGMNDSKEVEKVDSKGCFFFRCCGQKNQVAPICKSAMVNSKSDPLLSSKVESLPYTNMNNSYGGSQLSGQLVGLGGNRPTSRGSSMKGSRSGTPLMDVERNLNEINTSTSDLGRVGSFMGLSTLSVDGSVEKRKCILNIYLLNLTSPLLMLIRSAWNNFIFKSTLALEPEEIQISTEPSALTVSNSDPKWRDKVERNFNQLKRDMFQPHTSMEQRYSYVDQLFQAAKSNFMIKKFFWRGPDMFTFMITQLQKYLPRSAASLSTEEGKAQRADEMEYAILILSTLNLMLRETEVVSARLSTLKLESGKLVTDLLKILMCQPDLPYRPLTLTKHWSAPVAGGKKTDSEKNLDEELGRLKTEYTRVAITLVFELVLVAKQAPPEEESVLTVTGITSLFSEMKATEKFTDRLLSQIMELVSLSRFDLLSPVQAMLVFQMFSLLQTFTGQDKTVINHIRNNYYEEFKYFIQAPAVSRKLPIQYPITATTISIIDQVVGKVLGSQPRTVKDL